MTVRCGECGTTCELTKGAEVYPHRGDLAHLWFWICRACGAYCGCHKSHAGRADPHTPLGTPAGPKTREARSAAHREFDPLWKRLGRAKLWPFQKARSVCYRWLAAQLEIPADRCHIAMMNEADALRVVAVCRGPVVVDGVSLR